MAKYERFTLDNEDSLPEMLLSEGLESEEMDMNRRNVLLKLKHVDVKFNVRGRVLNAIRDANLEIFNGETIAIVGESGSGKSVMTKTFAGMLDSNGFISHGNIYFNDDSLAKTTVLLNRFNGTLRKRYYNLLCQYSFETTSAPYYQELDKLIDTEKKAKVLTPEDLERLEKLEKNLTDNLTDAKNLLATISRDKKSKERRLEVVSQIKGLEADLKQLEKDRKAAHKKAKADYKKDTAARSEFKAKKAELESKIAAEVASSREKGLGENFLARNLTIANEIILSIGRYPLHLRLRYGKQLLSAYRASIHRGDDLFTGKRNRRTFEPVMFRVEYTGKGIEETNALKVYLEGNFLSALKNPDIARELLDNESLIDQARGLHPHLRNGMIRKFKKAGLDKPEDIADLILLKMADFNSLTKARYYANRSADYAISYLKEGKEQSNCKPRPVAALYGYAHIDCAKVRYLKDWEQIRGCRIATVFQDPMTSLDPIITIGKQIMIVIQKHQHCSAFEAKRRALSIMRKVGIPEPEKRFDDYPFQYSGGMRQRIVIAIALSCQPKILICDEPTTALDVTIQAQILELIKKLSKDLGFTTVYITHDLGVVANVAERVAVLYGGQIVELGTVEDIFYDPRHPYTWALLSSMPQLARSGDELFSISGTPPSLYNKIVGDAFAPRNQYALAIDFKKEPPMFKVNDHHFAKTWLLDPRAPKVEKPDIICNLHEKMVAIYGEDGNIVKKDEELEAFSENKPEDKPLEKPIEKPIEEAKPAPKAPEEPQKEEATAPKEIPVKKVTKTTEKPKETKKEGEEE